MDIPKTTGRHVEPLSAFAKGIYWFARHVEAGEDLDEMPPKALATWREIRSVPHGLPLAILYDDKTEAMIGLFLTAS